MKAAVTEAVGAPFRVVELDVDAPVGQEVLVDVKASGLCHSDLYVAERGLGVPMPIVLGHELAGVVREVGPAVVGLAPGDHVVACLVRSCWVCTRCREGRPYQCLDPLVIERPPGAPPRLSRAGVPVDQFWGLSGFAEQALVHRNQLVKVPHSLPFDVASLLGCGVVTGAGAVVNTAQVRFGQSVAVFGCGGVGLNAVQAARLAGALRVVAVDLQPEKLELARRFGATDIVLAGDDTVAVIRELTGGLGVDHAFEVVGRTSTAEAALRCLAAGGTAYLIGLQKPGDVLGLEPDPDLMAPQVGLRGVHMGSANPQRDIPLYAELYLQGRLNLDDLVSARIGLSDIDDAYAELRTGRSARSVIVFD